MSAQLQRRKFGKTGLMVTELSFGSMNLRLMDTVAQSHELVNYALDQGINLVDTAREYNGKNRSGQTVESECIVGEVISRRELTEPLIVVTKGHGYTIPTLEQELALSRQKLGVEGRGDLTINGRPIKLVYFLHGINTERWHSVCESGVLQRLPELKAAGFTNYIGFSSHFRNGAEIKAAIDTGIFDVCELPYNIFHRVLGEDGDFDFLAYAHKEGLGVINMKAFGGNSMPAVQKIIGDYVQIDYPNMLNFCLANPYISTVDAGARRIAEFEQDVATALGKRLEPAVIAELKQQADKVSPYMENVCRECMHCLEKFSCPQGVDFPAVLALYSRYTISEKLGKSTSEYTEQYSRLAVNAEQCIECGECLPWCEYKLKVPDIIKQAQQTFGMG